LQFTSSTQFSITGSLAEGDYAGGSYGTGNITSSQVIVGSYDYPKWACFSSNFGGTFSAGDLITFNTVAANIDFNSSATIIEGDGIICSSGKDWFVKFSNVSISAGARITSAFIRVTALIDGSIDTENSNIRYVNDVPPTTGVEYYHGLNREKGTALITWTLPAFTADGTYDSGDIATVIEEAVGTDEWTSGDDLLLYIDAGGTSEKYIKAFEEGSGFAELHVGYLG